MLHALDVFEIFHFLDRRRIGDVDTGAAARRLLC